MLFCWDQANLGKEHNSGNTHDGILFNSAAKGSRSASLPQSIKHYLRAKGHRHDKWPSKLDKEQVAELFDLDDDVDISDAGFDEYEELRWKLCNADHVARCSENLDTRDLIILAIQVETAISKSDKIYPDREVGIIVFLGNMVQDE